MDPKLKQKKIILMVNNLIVIFTLIFSPARGGSNFMLRSGFSFGKEIISNPASSATHPRKGGGPTIKFSYCSSATELYCNSVL
jgi:hypothetical protein